MIKKMLLYATKNGPELYSGTALYDGRKVFSLIQGNKKQREYALENVNCLNNVQKLNGKVIGECEYEIERIEMQGDEINIFYGIEERSCLTTEQIENYLGYDNDYKGYAIHIKNLIIFDTPRNLSDYFSISITGGMLFTHRLEKAPQNMQRVSISNWEYGSYSDNDLRILTSIRPEWMYLIAKGDKTIEVRKKIIYTMLGALINA